MTHFYNEFFGWIRTLAGQEQHSPDQALWPLTHWRCIKIGARTEELPPYHMPAQRKIKVFFDKLIFKETIVELWNVLQRWFTNSIPIMFGEDKKSIQVWEQAAFYFGAVFYFIWFYQQNKTPLELLSIIKIH